MAILQDNTDPIAVVIDSYQRNSNIDPDNDIDNFINNHYDAFVQVSLPEENWNQAFPYQLRIVDSAQGYKQFKNYSYTLPIPPQELNIQLPFAINLQPTMKGISEDHSGIPFRLININATTGVVPQKVTSFGPANQTIASSIFAGTLSAANQVGESVKSLLGQNAGPDNLMGNIGDGPDDLPQGSTGFYHHKLLLKFLELYGFLKKQAKYRTLRLGFVQYKTNEMYIVTPISFNSKQSSSSPLEYQWTLQLKAWQRLQIDGIIIPPVVSSARDPNALAQLSAKIQDIRDTLQGLSNVILGFNGDVQAVVFEPLREAGLVIKDAIGISITAADLPSNIIKEFKLSVLDSWNQIKNQIDYLNTDPNLRNWMDNSATINAHTNSNNSSVQSALSNSDPINNIFNNPIKYYSFFSQITPTSLNLPNTVIGAIEQEKNRIRLLTKTDIQNKVTALQSFVDSIAVSLGMSSNSYNSIYNISSPTTIRSPTDDDYEILFALNAAIISLQKLVATYHQTDNTGIPTALEYVSGLASRSGIAFTVPTSKMSIPLPYGVTLEKIAEIYLKDPNRWIEIATLNGLREPYIDEEGFDLALLFNGKNNNIVLSDISNLYKNQIIYISSNSLSPIKKQILNIQSTGNNYTITLDGDPVDSFKVSDGAKIHAYLPGTVNSQMLIFIPSEESANNSLVIKKIPGTNDFDGLLSMGGIDLLLDGNGDIVLTPSGSTKLSFGLTNLIQSAKIALSTVKGSLLGHPDYGIGVQIGSSSAEVSTKDILNSALNLFNNDPRYSKVLSASISKQGPTVSISLSVQVANTNHILPITVQL